MKKHTIRWGFMFILSIVSFSSLKSQCVLFKYDLAGNRISGSLDSQCNGLEDPNYVQKTGTQQLNSTLDTSFAPSKSIVKFQSSSTESEWELNNIESNQDRLYHVSVYPNPTLNKIFINGIPTKKTVWYQLIHVSTGNLIQDKEQLNTNSIRLGHLASGTYQLKIFIEGISFDFEVIKL